MTQEKRIKDLSFEEAMEELETIVRNLEAGQTSLENSIELYERGSQLKKHCAEKLRDAQAKIEKISIDKDNALSTQPLDTEE